MTKTGVWLVGAHGGVTTVERHAGDGRTKDDSRGKEGRAGDGDR